MGVCRLQSQLSRLHSRSRQPKFETIASACVLGIGLDNFIAMTRLARTSDSGAARFLDAWDALEETEQPSAASADAVCEQIGLAPLDLLKAVADATLRYSMYTARLRTAVAMPSIVERSIEVALTEEGVERVPFLWPNLRGIARRLNRDRAEDARSLLLRGCAAE